VNVATQVCQNIYHLFITCNKNGALATYTKDHEQCYTINLTDETHDRGFAMTSSFTNMYLATYLCFHLDALDDAIDMVKDVIITGENYLENGYQQIQEIVNAYTFDRIVYLGSGCLKGIAQESSLKMLELTAGQVATMYDAPLGFRHGPKSIVNDTTLTVVYLSDNAYTRKYEVDLIKEMSKERKSNKIVAVLNQEDSEVSSLVDYTICFDAKRRKENVLLGLNYILFAQVLAVFTSLFIGNTPDDPCPSGEVNRVVQGVTLYPYADDKN
jgi:tagatose-6-phosphate ketose/aldose isomerase